MHNETEVMEQMGVAIAHDHETEKVLIRIGQPGAWRVAHLTPDSALVVAERLVDQATCILKRHGSGVIYDALPDGRMIANFVRKPGDDAPEGKLTMTRAQFDHFVSNLFQGALNAGLVKSGEQCLIPVDGPDAPNLSVVPRNNKDEEIH